MARWCGPPGDERAEVTRRLEGLLAYLTSLERWVAVLREIPLDDAAARALAARQQAEARDACFLLRQAIARLEEERDAGPGAGQ
ncbi:MAG: hypothetical protein RJA36_3086 [Pseudomonadota bacterium]|jgi:hypothetical protein